MRLISALLMVVFCGIDLAVADVIPNPFETRLPERLADNPRVYDRVDNFCTGKKIGEACSVPGDVFAGGGEGVCLNKIVSEDITLRYGTIDLLCVQNNPPVYDRKLPCDPVEEGTEAHPITVCKYMTPPPADQFCANKKLGDACSVSFSYQGNAEQREGICALSKEVIAEKAHYGADLTRPVVLCSPPTVVERTYVTIPWWKKLFQ